MRKTARTHIQTQIHTETHTQTQTETHTHSHKHTHTQTETETETLKKEKTIMCSGVWTTCSLYSNEVTYIIDEVVEQFLTLRTLIIE